MLMDIFASILQPRMGEDYVVIVSAYRSDPDHSIGMYPSRKGKATSAEEAEEVAKKLVEDLRQELERQGHQIRAVNIKR